MPKRKGAFWGCAHVTLPHRSTLLAMIDSHINLKDFAVLTDEAAPGIHRGNDGRDAEALQAMASECLSVRDTSDGALRHVDASDR